jgi:hypothetical protein
MQLARIAIGAKVWIIDISDKISNREANQWDSSSNMLDKMGSRTGKSTLDQVNHLEFFWGVQRGLNHWAGCLTNPYGNKIMALLRFKFMQIGKKCQKFPDIQNFQYRQLWKGIWNRAYQVIVWQVPARYETISPFLTFLWPTSYELGKTRLKTPNLQVLDCLEVSERRRYLTTETTRRQASAERKFQVRGSASLHRTHHPYIEVLTRLWSLDGCQWRRSCRSTYPTPWPLERKDHPSSSCSLDTSPWLPWLHILQLIVHDAILIITTSQGNHHRFYVITSLQGVVYSFYFLEQCI